MRNKIVEGLSAITTSTLEVKPDIMILQFTIVNAFLIGDPGSADGKWVLIDTGLENSADFILKTVEERFGKNSRPEAIILTHGHFDHVGSLIKLSETWDVPVYAHELEIPYVTGEKDYPLGDDDVDEGMVAKMSPSFPHTSIDIGERAKALPADGSVPGMDGWTWVHTPGHTEGHVSLFREKDRVLIVGDAFSTVKQESLISAITQEETISGPPKYLTPDWESSKTSIEILKALKPSLAITSHGRPIAGEELNNHLKMLIDDFAEIAKPR